MHGELLDVQTTHVNGSALVTVSGEIDAHSVITLDAALHGLGAGTHAILDLGDVRFIDSSGLRVLILHVVRLREAGGSLAITNASAAVLRVATIAGVGELVERADSGT
jgi:anti-sigma B factor antagonist